MLTAKNWAEIVEQAGEFIEFLKSDNFFSQPYTTDRDYCVITDVDLAMNFSTDRSWDKFTDWETVVDSQFPEDFDWQLNSRINYQLQQNNYYDLFTKNLNGLLEKWTTFDGQAIAEELIMHDIAYILNCYANRYFPPIWQEILQVYYAGGLPCGWNGFYPDGKMVVFSHQSNKLNK
ncbi:hypothetical protein [Acinetobacter sp.]|jgi:hypothetical protein|uniref:hypothetical protein n=1 Tax=Acinetobacter sp. TaxID=472 RepID=UPI003341C16E